MTANRAGWTTSTRPGSAAASAPRSTSVSDQSTCGARARSHSAMRAANTGEGSSSSTPMPIHCEPWPGKTNDRTGRRRGGDTRTTAGWASPVGERGEAGQRGCRGRRRRRRPGARTRDRVVASDQPTSADRRRRVVGEPVAPAARPGRAGRRRCGRTAPTGTTVSVGRGLVASGGAGSGACSRMTCALVPLMPNDETAGPARPVAVAARARLGQQPDRARRPVDVRRRLVDVQRRRAARRAASP